MKKKREAHTHLLFPCACLSVCILLLLFPLFFISVSYRACKFPPFLCLREPVCFRFALPPGYPSANQSAKTSDSQQISHSPSSVSPTYQSVAISLRSYSINQRTYFPATQTVNHHQNQPIYSPNQSVIQIFICIFFNCWFKIFTSLMLVILISTSLNYILPLHFFQYTFISLTSRFYIS